MLELPRERTGKWYTVNAYRETYIRLKTMAESGDVLIADVLKQAVDKLWEKATSPEGYSFEVKVIVKIDEENK